MKYMLLIYLDEKGRPSEAEQQKCYVESAQYAHKLHASGKFLASAPLHPTSTATSVRQQDGRPLVTDGPFAETREQLGGYFFWSMPKIWTKRFASLQKSPLGDLERWKFGRLWKSAVCRLRRRVHKEAFMCPECISNIAMVAVAGITSTGGLTALLCKSSPGQMCTRTV